MASGPPEPQPGPVPTPAPDWLRFARALQSIAQAGLTYAQDPFDRERYEQIRTVAAEIAAAGTDAPVETIRGFFASERGYPTPKLDVRAAVIVEDRILLVQEHDDGGWTMPGGWADIGESAAESVVRETREEAGIEVRADKLIALHERERHGHPPHPEFSHKVFFACVPVGDPAPSPRPGPGAEIAAAAFFERDRLPPLSVARVTPEQIELAFTHHAHPDLPTAFD
jgi:ADP-ribose pyrophosphatase YjhB (NUDIX family)